MQPEWLPPTLSSFACSLMAGEKFVEVEVEEASCLSSFMFTERTENANPCMSVDVEVEWKWISQQVSCFID